MMFILVDFALRKVMCLASTHRWNFQLARSCSNSPYGAIIGGLGPPSLAAVEFTDFVRDHLFG